LYYDGILFEVDGEYNCNRSKSGREGIMSQPICPICGSKIILYMPKTDSFLCRKCGHSWPREKK
jgi:ribosomal protein L37AE/L43A